MIFFTKILAITSASVSGNNMTTDNMSIQSQEKTKISYDKERLIEKISELRHEIDKINRYYQDLQSGTADIFEQGESVDYLKKLIKKQKNHINKLSDAIKENTQALENKNQFIEILRKRAETFGAKIRLKKIEIQSLKTQKSETIIFSEHQDIIKEKQEEKKSILAKIRIINKKIQSLKIKIDKKADEVIFVQNKFSTSIETLADINSAIKQCPSDKTEALIVLNELLESSIESVGIYNSSLISAKQEKMQLESELEQFWASNAFKKMEYKNRVKEIKKEIQENAEKQASSIANYNINNVNKAAQMHELLVSSEILYHNMLHAIKDKKEEITFHENNNDQLYDSFVFQNKQLALIEQKLAKKIERIGTSTEAIKQNIINDELEKSNNISNSLIQEKHDLEKQLVQLSFLYL